jgi:hypothetical protein
MDALEIRFIHAIENGDAKRDALAINNDGLFFHSSARINLLKRYLNAEDVSFAVMTGETMIGYLNVLVKSGPLGNVANSSPFYGSNGGIILDRTLSEEVQLRIRQKIIEFYYQLENDRSIDLTCLITNPLYKDDEFYRQNFSHDLEDFRIGQLTPLPGSVDLIFPAIHSKTRNLVRKAQNSGFQVKTTQAKEDVAFLYDTHKENMEEIGGKAKEKDYFEQLMFSSDYPWKLWIASREDERAAAMLLYTYGGIIEYVTPVIKKKFRSDQPLSLLIYEAMKTAVDNGARWWNWGGTWKTQDGVYHFKNRWGALDLRYYYFIRFRTAEATNRFLSATKDALLDSYPYFFTVPFEQLRQPAVNP